MMLKIFTAQIFDLISVSVGVSNIEKILVKINVQMNL